MITEIFVENQRVDITADLDSLLTFALDDVKNFASRQTTFSKTVVLPGTVTNNKLFGSIFETGVSNDYDPAMPNIGVNFNPAKSARCIIFQDNLQTFKGTIRLLTITRDRRRIDYEVALNGELTSLNVALSAGYLEDLDFSAYNTYYSVGSVVGSWNNAPGSGLYFPLIDYGNYSVNKHDWDIRTFKPALYVKEFIDKMFAAAKFRYTCPLFNTDKFKRLIIPYNKKVFQGLTTEQFSADRSNNANYIDQSTFPNRAIQMTTVNGTIFTASLSNSRFTYVGTDPLTAHFTFSCGNTIKRELNDFSILVRKNGVTVAGSLRSYPHNNIAFAGFYSYGFTFDDTVVNGDYFELVATANTTIFNTDFMQCNNAGIGCTSVVSTLAPVGVGSFFEVNQALPQNIRQVDFLVSIVKLFNLYIYESKFDERMIMISPFVDFYQQGEGSIIDWTYKLDRNQPITITPMSEINSKVYNFNYKADTDFYNDLYKKRYNEVYGSYVFDSQFEFASQTNTLELIFAPTPLVGYAGEDKVYPTIFKRTGTTTLVEEPVDSVIRIMSVKKIIGVTPWSIKDGATAILGLNYYGYAGHFDDPDSPTYDLNFGAVKELFFELVTGDLTKTQFNVYWSVYMAEITDKESKLLKAKFRLKPSDIFNLDFSKYITIDGVLYRLNKIVDYNASKPDTCTVELLKSIYTNYTFPLPIPLDDFIIDWSDGEELLTDDTEDFLYD